MAPLVSCSIERLQRIGWEAAKKMKRKEKMAPSVSLSCEYLGVCVGEGKFDASSAASASRDVGFEWRVKADAHAHTQVVTVRCDNLGARGVPFPKGWATALCSTWTSMTLLTKPWSALSRRAKLKASCCQLLGRPQRASCFGRGGYTGRTLS